MSGPPGAPGTRQATDEQTLLLGSIVAGLLIGFGVRRKNVVGTAAGVAGAGVLAALFAPRIAPRIAPRVTDAVARRAIDVNTQFIVHKPRAAVFDFFRNFENFPLVGGLLHSVEDFDDGRSRWRVLGRGTLVEWDVIVTKYLPPRVIGWESTAGAPVESVGTVRFDALDAATTRVRIALHYRPLSDAAVRAFHGRLLRRPERRVRAAIGRIESAMERALEPDVHHRGPRYPLPEPPVPGPLSPPASGPSAQT